VSERKQVRRNRKCLEDERARLQSGLLSCTQPPSAEHGRPGYGTHMADDATAVFEQAKNLAVSLCLRQTLQQVNKALDKLDSGTYGVCEKCGFSIRPARLEALPHATLCVSCQARAERGA
jgi:DnaK suppressor protein